MDIEKVNDSLRGLKEIAEKELGCELMHLAVAWVLGFRYTSTALIGARNSEQLLQLLKCMEVVDKLTPELEARINKIMGTQPNQRMDWKSFTPQPHFRPYP